MTYKQLTDIIKTHNISEDVHLVSDSGWECYDTEMDGVWYYAEKNTIIFTQGGKYEKKRGYLYEGKYPCECLFCEG